MEPRAGSAAFYGGNARFLRAHDADGDTQGLTAFSRSGYRHLPSTSLRSCNDARLPANPDDPTDTNTASRAQRTIAHRTAMINPTTSATTTNPTESHVNSLSRRRGLLERHHDLAPAGFGYRSFYLANVSRHNPRARLLSQTPREPTAPSGCSFAPVSLLKRSRGCRAHSSRKPLAL
jgi:hypothetical protein